jgi:FtsP/CotA-like multicopper oxidase with cupredoxin domain
MKYPLLCLFLFAATLGVGASVLNHPHDAAAAQITAPCVPNVGSYRGMLPQPPVVDPASFPNHAITLNVVQGPASEGGTARYCYTLAGSTSPFIDAPTIRVHQGETFTLHLVDRIPKSSSDAHMPMPSATAPDGCSLLPFEGTLPPASQAGYLGQKRVYATMPPMISNDTNIHTHGWDVSPDVDNVFKSLALSGGSCTYRFAVPITQTAGTYWYHAHLHGLANSQVGGGLAGALIVLPSAAPSMPPLPERVLLVKVSTYPPVSQTNRMILARKALAEMRTMHVSAPAVPKTYDPFNPPEWPTGWPIPEKDRNYCPTSGSLLGHWVVNGYPVQDPTQPSLVPAKLPLAPGRRELLRIIDATSNDFMNVRLRDASGKYEQLDVVGRDGHPVAPSGDPEGLAATFSNVILPPGGRADIVVTGASTPQTLVSDQLCTGNIGPPTPARNVITIQPALAANAAHAVRPLRVARAGETAGDKFYRAMRPLVVRRRVLTFTQYIDKDGKNFAWYVTDTTKPGAFTEQPFWLSPPKPGDHEYLPEIRVPQNSVEQWVLVNASPEIHAFHIHQLTFVTDSNPFEGPHLHVFQDTVALPAAKIDPSRGGGDTPYLIPSKTVITIDFRHVNKGTFVYHCHMLFHEDHGMMGIIQVY